MSVVVFLEYGWEFFKYKTLHTNKYWFYVLLGWIPNTRQYEKGDQLKIIPQIWIPFTYIDITLELNMKILCNTSVQLYLYPHKERFIFFFQLKDGDGLNQNNECVQYKLPENMNFSINVSKKECCIYNPM